jgi:hypothetical protein
MPDRIVGARLWRAILARWHVLSYHALPPFLEELKQARTVFTLPVPCPPSSVLNPDNGFQLERRSRKGGISLLTPPSPRAWDQSLPPMLRIRRHGPQAHPKPQA